MTNWRDLAIAGGLALCAAIVMGVALPSLSAPADYRTRLETIEVRAAETRRLVRAAKAAPPLRPGAVCADANAAVGGLRQALIQTAGQLQLETSRIDVAESGDEVEGLTALAVRFEASGGYEAALALLERLDGLQPQIFADAIDLTSHTSSVTLNFSGRAFCSA